jgi:hypothetical protein
MIITDTDKKLFAEHKKAAHILNAWELGEKYTLPVKMMNPKTGRQRLCNLTVKPCNGETNYNTIGLSKGYIHFEYIDYSINKRTHGFCGIPYFFKNAKQ